MNSEIVPFDEGRTGIRPFQPTNVFDLARFEQVSKVASVMARSTMIPQHLTHVKAKGGDPEPLSYDQVYGNCFLVANTAANWGMDPFAVAQATSLVHGRLCFEGKLVAAVLDHCLGIVLTYQFGVWDNDRQVIDLSREGVGDDLAVRVIECGLDGKPKPNGRFIDGCVRQWKTTGNNSPWSPPNYRRQLRYRGAREFARAHEPAIMLGVYSPDEFDDAEDTVRSNRARDVTPAATRNPLLSDESDRQSDVAKSAAQTGRKTEPEARAAATETAAKADAASDAAASGEPLGREVFERYDVALRRFDTKENIEKAAAQFWKAAGGWPPPIDADRKLAKLIYDLHVSRAAGQVNAQDVEVSIKERVAEHFGEDL